MAESQSVPASPLKETAPDMTATIDSGIDGGGGTVDETDAEQRFDSLAILPEGESSEQEQDGQDKDGQENESPPN